MLLAVETSDAVGSVALVRDGQIVEERTLGAERDHARFLAPTVKELVQGRADALTGYALSLGPGSFTGLRIGLAFLKGFASAHPRPGVGVSSLEVRACSIDCDTDVLVLLDARRGQVFVGRYQNGVALVPDRRAMLTDVVAELGELALVVTGDGVPAELPSGWRRADADGRPRAGVLGQRAALRFAESETVPVSELDPVYLQLSGAEERFGPAPGTPEAAALKQDGLTSAPTPADPK